MMLAGQCGGSELTFSVLGKARSMPPFKRLRALSMGKWQHMAWGARLSDYFPEP